VDFNYMDLGHRAGGSVVRVTLEGNAANVRLMDYSNYRSFQAKGRHEFVGGHYDRSPSVLKVPHSGHWFVTIDYGGFAGHGRAAVEVFDSN
jgi:hypothetical protein